MEHGKESRVSCSQQHCWPIKQCDLSYDGKSNTFILELVKLMRHPETGVPLRAVKSFLSRIPDVFTGEDLVGWLRKTYDIDTADEAIHLGTFQQ